MALTIGATLFGLGALITCFNIYVGYLRFLIHRLRGGTRESFQYVSGIALFGSLFLWCSIPLLYDRPPWAWIALVLSLVDTGGIHWFAGTMLWEWWSDRRRAS
jgi:hypothetical protein